ncbi:MAG TPA: hypothetical protein VKQ36_07990 [Ktedonobacterales bacterium]|nr:hypothetical protein [Ktedonobacterales bacterium]
MPKQHNHPHHHSSEERHERASSSGGLQLPQWRWGPRWSGYLQYPPGWKAKPGLDAFLGSAQSRWVIMLLAGLLVVGCIAIVLLAQLVR